MFKKSKEEYIRNAKTNAISKVVAAMFYAVMLIIAGFNLGEFVNYLCLGGEDYGVAFIIISVLVAIVIVVRAYISATADYARDIALLSNSDPRLFWIKTELPPQELKDFWVCPNCSKKISCEIDICDKCGFVPIPIREQIPAGKWQCPVCCRTISNEKKSCSCGYVKENNTEQ